MEFLSTDILSNSKNLFLYVCSTLNVKKVAWKLIPGENRLALFLLQSLSYESDKTRAYLSWACMLA